MNPVDSILEQEKNGRLVVKLLDVDKYGGKDTSKLTGREELALRQQIADSTGRFLHVPAVRMTPEGIDALWEREKRMGREGIILRSLDDRSLPMYKVKAAETWDFPITGIAPVKTGRASTVRSTKEIEATRNPGSKWLPEGVPLGAGYVTYDSGKEAVGKAGSGLSDEQRRDMWENPDAYLGKDNVVFEDGMYKAKDPSKVLAWVEVRGMSRSEQTGIVRAPVVEEIRFDKARP
jgi:ATP-dependent DNA ligase